MHLPIQYLATLIIVLINFITFWTMAKGSGHFVTNGDSIIVGRCIKRQKQIICPMGKSHLARLHQATSSNSSLELGPSMYHRRFTISNIDSAIAQSPIRPVAKSKTHVIYYTKQYDHHHHSSSSSSSSSSPVDHNNGGGQNVFDFNDEEEHEFMHEPKIEENVIDDGHQVKKINKDKIKMFIDENKSMIRRMFGDYQYNSKNQMEGKEEQEEEEELIRDHYSSFHDGPDWKRRRPKRSIKPTPLSGNKVDSCESSVEIVTPYWASNSAGKIRAIVNTQHLQQAIQQEVCQAVQTRRCNKDCRCEQKYKWHRLLAYDPDDDCKGIFMDWFLFPSCCVCRCIKY